MSYVVFSDVGGTVMQGTPWNIIRKHPSYNKVRGNIELVRFIPTFVLKQLTIIGESEMRKQWLARMAASFTGLSRDIILKMYRDAIENDFQHVLRHDVIARLQEHKQQGATVVLVSGIFTDLVQQLAEYIGADCAIGTQVEYKNDKATGRLYGDPCVGQNKIDYIHQYMRDNHPNIKLEDCYGYADSYSDRALLSAVGHGVATYPDELMRETAEDTGWELFPA